MAYNHVNGTLSPEDQAAVMEAITTLRDKLPFLITLTLQERKSLVKVGDEGWGFINKALEVATQNPEFLPRSFDISQMRNDVELLAVLQSITIALTQLQDLLNDSTLALRSQTYRGALTIYRYGKDAKSDVALSTLMRELGRRFARTSRQVPPETN